MKKLFICLSFILINYSLLVINCNAQAPDIGQGKTESTLAVSSAKHSENVVLYGNQEEFAPEKGSYVLTLNSTQLNPALANQVLEMAKNQGFSAIEINYETGFVRAVADPTVHTNQSLKDWVDQNLVFRKSTESKE